MSQQQQQDSEASQRWFEELAIDPGYGEWINFLEAKHQQEIEDEDDQRHDL